MPITLGTWQAVQASEVVANGAMSAGTSTPVDTVNHKHLLEFRLSVTAAPAAGNVDLYRRRSDGTNTAPTPTAGYKYDYVGTFNLDAATGEYYSGQVSNLDPNDQFYWFNNTGSSVTATLYGRTVEYS